MRVAGTLQMEGREDVRTAAGSGVTDVAEDRFSGQQVVCAHVCVPLRHGCRPLDRDLLWLRGQAWETDTPGFESCLSH